MNPILGCMILFSDQLEYKIISSRPDDNGRFLMVKCEIQDTKFFLMNVYAPNDETEHAAYWQTYTVIY